MVAFKSNHMTSIPENAFPRKLRWLILTDNEIESVPESIGSCERLQKCMLAGNKLVSLPDSMAKCRKLGLLRLSSNKLAALPGWLFELPELTFLSFAGNPCSRNEEAGEKTQLETIPWTALQERHLLGEGASGVISAGTWTPPVPENAQGIDVAIKLFKGTITSDGSPMDEMEACIAAGSHENLIDPIGRIDGHPEKRGLVLELISPKYKNLGLPPTLQSCTRDAFHPETSFVVGQVIKVLSGIAGAARQLHERGIAHGDLYAHNILVDGTGHALLGDFGAATVYGEGKYEKKLERLEVAAFGLLVEDMLGLVERKIESDELMDEKEWLVLEALNALYLRCSNPVVGDRPRFGDICAVIETL